ncbi:hypothetical protein GCM10027258_93460 [Amycolatopsis stemonae]
MTTVFGWRPSPDGQTGVVFAGGVFRTELLHRVHSGAPVVRLESQNAADLGWLNRYVVFAVCGCLCWPARADVAVDQREHCPACWKRAMASPAEEHHDLGATANGGSVRRGLEAPLRPPDAALQPAVAVAIRPRLLSGALPAGHVPLRLRRLAEPDAACITAADAADAYYLPAAAADHHAA